jgi:hypothetical protein
MDLDSASSATKNGILNKVTEYIDDLDRFVEGGPLNGVIVGPNQYNLKQLDLIINRMPEGDQYLGILEAVNYANSKNINLNLVIAK